MATSLGALFLKAALGPVEHAGQCIMGRQVEAGLQDLTRDSLLGAVQRGMAAVAREAGVSVNDVAGLLPMTDVQQAAAQVDHDQQQAVHAWNQHTGHFGGLLEGITDLTQDGQPPDVSLCLSRLAFKVKADKAWSGPLKALSKSSMWYLELLRHCAELLASGTALEQARAARRTRRLMIAGGIVLLALIIGAGGGWWVLRAAKARGRVAVELAKGEVCAVESVAEGDLELASQEQKQAVAERRQQCVAERERAERLERERKEKEAAEKKKAELAKERAAACARLATALQAGKLDAEAATAAGDSLALLRRVALGRLEAEDLAPPASQLPCTELPEGKPILEAYAKAVVLSTGAWLTAEDLSDPVRKILTDHKEVLRDRPKLLYGLHAETQAQRALVSGDPQAVARALRLCDLKRSLEIVRGPYCDSLASNP